MNYSQYMSPEDAQRLAEMGDPQDDIEALLPMQRLANQTGGIKRLGEYGNGRVIGANSPLEALGGVAQNAMGAYMQKDLAGKYGDIFKQANKNRGSAAGMLVNALRSAKDPMSMDEKMKAYANTGMSMGSDGMIGYDPNAGY